MTTEVALRAADLRHAESDYWFGVIHYDYEGEFYDV